MKKELIITKYNTKEEDILTVGEVASFLGIGVSTIHVFAKEYGFKSYDSSRVKGNLNKSIGNRVYLKYEIAEALNIDKDDIFMRPNEAFKYIGVSLATLWNYVRSSKIKKIKLSERVTLFSKKELDRYMRGD